MSDYYKKKLEELNKSSESSYYKKKLEELERKKKYEDAIAPIKIAVATTTSPKKKKDEERTWFNSGLFEDGWQKGDLTKTILGSGTDLLEDIGTGIIGMGEKALDGLLMLGGAMNNQQMMQTSQQQMIFNTVTGKESNGILERTLADQKQIEKDISTFVQKDLYNEEEVAKKLITKPVEYASGINVEDTSVLGAKSDSLVQSAGQLLGTAGLQVVGVPWFLTTGATAYGSQAETALNEGASFNEANASALISAGAEILTEKLSGGIKFGGKTLDDVLVKSITDKISSKALKKLANLGFDAFGEGAEEVVSSVMSNLGTALYKEEDLSEILASEEAFDEYLESFIGGAVLGGVSSGVRAIRSGEENTYTETEQKVIDKEVENRIAELEKDGKKLSKQDKSKIYDEVITDLDKGAISIDTIESVLGGDEYTSYQDATKKQSELQKEYDELYQMKNGDKSDAQIDRQSELKQQLEELKNNSITKEQIYNNVYNVAKDSRLVESYNEKARRGQLFEADLSKYNEKEKAVVQKAIDSGVLNNTNRTHDFVDLIAKISAEKGISFDFTNNEKLKESGFSFEDKTIDGFVNGNDILLNIDSPKAHKTVVGHEITHILEGTELYAELEEVVKQYATTKGEYAERMQTLRNKYTGIYEGKDFDEKIRRELTADIVGEYLFSDEKFIHNLSTEQPSLFKKIYDEIKYLCKIATSGSKEAREFEKLKRTFERIYKETGTVQKGETKYSVSDDGYYRANELQTELNQVRNSIKEIESSDEFKTVVNNLTKAINNDDAENGTKAYMQWKEESGYKSLLEKKNTLQTELDSLKKKISEESKSKALEEERNAIAKSGLSEADYFRKQAVKEFGYTPYFYDAGYITPNGKMLNFSGEKGKHYGSRGQDHRAIGIVYAETSGTDALNRFIKDGNVRIMAESPGIDISTVAEPTKEQYSTIRKFVYEYGDKESFFNVDFTDESGNVIGSLTYENNVNATRILNDIKHFYATGEIRQQSNVDKFRYSLSENIENSENILYNSNSPLSIVNRATSNNNSSINWVYKAEIFSVAENKQFHQKISEINQGSQAFTQNSRGEYMLPIENKIIFTDGNYDSPYIREIVEVLTEYQTEFEEIRGRIFDVEEGKSTKQDEMQIIEQVLGNGNIISYTNRNNGVYDWQNGKRKGKTRRAVVRNYLNKQYGTRNDKQSTEFEAGLNESAFSNAQNDEYSLSNEGDVAPVKRGNEALKDFAYQPTEEVAPVENTTTTEDVATTNDDEVIYQESIATDDEIAPTYDEIESTENRPITTVKERVAEKIKGVETEIANNKQHQQDSIDLFNAKISQLQEEYANKKNKNTKVANDILRRIEELNRKRDSVNADYSKRISDLEKRLEKMNTKEFATAEQRKTKQQEYTEQMEELAGDTSTWKDKKLGIQYKVNTLRRNLRDIVRDENGKRDIAKADAIYDELQGKYNHNEAELNREANRIKKQFADMKITNAESTYIQMLGELRHNPDTTLTEDVVKEFYEEHKKNIDEAKVDKAIEEARKLYDDLLLKVNQVLSEQGMKEIPYRQGYFPHFTEEKQGRLAKLFNWKTQNNDIPTDIAGLTETFTPNRSWQSFNKQRTSDTTDYNFLKGLDTYVQGSLDWIYHIEDIQKRRAFENHIRYVHSEKGVQEKIDAIRNNEEYDAEEMQEQIDIIYREASNPLNNFVSDFRTATNTLAGKKSSLDRGMEELTNRKFYSTMTNLNNRVSANMVGGSISSALTNFVPITQSWGQVSPVSSLRAMKDTLASTFRDDGTIDKSDFLTNRLRKADNLYKTTWDKVGEGISFLMESIDNFTSQTVWRSKYLENISKGMSENSAIKDADQFAENVIAGRSRGNNPTIFDSKNPLAKVLTVFQLEVNNQYGYMFKDMPQDMANESKKKLVKGYATMFIGAYVYNALYSSLVGRDVAFDPIGILEDLLRDLGFGNDDEEDEEISPTKALFGLTDNILEETPFIGGLLGGGRIPISSALPYDGIYEAYKGTVTDLSEGNYKNLTKEWLNPIFYLAMPMGGGQIRKSVQGLSMFDDDLPTSGSYTDSGSLRFPVEDNLGNRVQAGLFGQYANKNARAYFDNDIAPLKEKQIKEYIDVDLPIADYWKYRKGLSKFDKQDDKVNYINGLDVSEEQKNVLKSYLYDEEGWKADNPEKYAFLESEGVGFLGYREADTETQEAWSWAFNHQDEYRHYKENGVMPEDYSVYRVPMLEFDDESDSAYEWAYDNPEKAVLGKAFNNGVKEYRQYATDLSEIRADKNANGNSISGSAKRKKIEYIFGLDIDYGSQCILFRSQYTSDDTYNYDIIEYLNTRDDITFAEKQTLLKELDIELDDEGNVYW